MTNRWVVKNGLVEIAILLLMLFCLGTAHAQVQVEPGVARISLIHGEVSTQRGDSGDWAAASLNAPIVSGDRISTGDSSRAEVQLDYSNLVRLGNRSQVTISGLSKTQIQIQVAEGIVNYTVFKDSESEPEIDTPNVAIHPYRKDGSFRIEAFSNDETRIIARNGEADITTPQGSTKLKKGEMITVRGTAEEAQYQVTDAPGRDDWDRFNNDRDNMIHSAESWRNTNRYYVGSEDLDGYGNWRDIPDYGRVWVPAVAPDWVPYRDGRWVWEPYYGWTWVSYEPWGWAPYHYGRWFYYGASWVWWPGQVYYRPIWAPAYVSFFGFGGGLSVSVGFGFGHVGWLPIGPCDRFYPWYGRYGGTRFNQVNIVNVTNITNVRNVGYAPLHAGNGFSNLRAMNDPQVRRAFSTVPAEHFGTGRVAATGVNSEMLRDGRMMTGNLPVVPSRESLLVSNRAASPGTMRSNENQRFFGRQAAAPERFDNQAAQVRQAIQRDGQFTPIQAGGVTRTGAGGGELQGRGLGEQNRVGNSTMGQGRDAATGGMERFPNSGGGTATNGNNNNNGDHGFQRIPSGGNATGRSDSPAAVNNGGDRGWQHFPSSSGGNPTGRGDSPAATNNGNNGNDRGWQHFPSSSGGNTTGRSDSSAAGNNSNNGNNGNDRGWQRFPSGNSGSGHTDSPTNNPSSNSGSGRENRGWGQRSSGGSDNPGRSDSPAPSNNPGSVNRSEDRGWHSPSSNSGGNSGGSQPSNRGSWGGSSGDSGSRGWGHGDSGGGGSSRPALDMRQPVVTPRSSGGGSFGGGFSGASRSSGGDSGGSRSGGGNSSSGSRSSSSSSSSQSESRGRSDSPSSERGRSR
jgi:hypothetical protein